MAQNCFTFPTATQTNVITTETPSTTYSLTTTTIPSSTSLFTSVSCLPDAPSSGSVCGHPTTLTLTSTFPPVTSTISNPVTVPVPVTRTDVFTQYGSSCTKVEDPPTSLPPPPPTSQSTSQSIMSNGQTTYVTVMVTPSTSAAPQNNDSNGNNKPANLGAIIGGTVGGVFGIVAIVLVVWFVLKRRRRWDDIFDKDDDAIDGGNRFSLSEDVEPKPYQYGLVGYTPSPGASSPPGSPPLRPTTQLSHNNDIAYTGMSNITHSTSTSSGVYSAQGTHPNLAPLHMPMTTSIAPGLSPHSMSTSRPSTAGSMQPLTNRPPSAGHGSATSNRPPSAGHGSAVPNRPPSAGQGSAYPPSSQYHNRTQSYLSGHSNAASLSSPPLQPLGWGMAAATPPPLQHHISGNSEDFGQQRSGSPVSFQEPRRQLHIANQRTSTATWDDGSSVASPVTSTHPTNSTAPTVSSRADNQPQRDGKGRLVLRNSEAVVQHTDGGLLESAPQASGSQAATASSSNSTSNDSSLPPAYTSLQ